MNSYGPDLSRRIPELDGIRGIAIAMVLLYHYVTFVLVVPPATTLSYLMIFTRLGWSGVDLFFVLSGLLIGGILLDARESSNYFRAFYVRRFFRIIPLYFAFLLVAFGLNAAGISGDVSGVRWGGTLPVASYFFFVQNFWMAARTVGGIVGLGVTWSLAVEEQFYLTLPPLIRFLSRRGLILALVAGVFFAPILRVILHSFAPQCLFSWYMIMPCRADALLLGVLGAMLLRDDRWTLRLKRNRRVLIAFVLTSTVCLGLFSLRVPGPFDFGMLTVGYTWLAAFYLCVVLCALLYRESWFAAFLRSGWLTWLGSIAYGTYLLHELVRVVLRNAILRIPSETAMSHELGNSVLALTLTLGICRLSWIYFEKPLIQIGHRVRYEFETSEAAAASSVVPAEGN